MQQISGADLVAPILTTPGVEIFYALQIGISGTTGCPCSRSPIWQIKYRRYRADAAQGGGLPESLQPTQYGLFNVWLCSSPAKMLIAADALHGYR
jgi:hypothetical protein